MQSRIGRGTTATFWLPAAEIDRREAQAARQVAAAPGRHAPARILVVDDDVLIAKATVEMLEYLGHAALEANSAATALKLLNEKGCSRSFDHRPYTHITGVELSRIVRKDYPDLPIC